MLLMSDGMVAVRLLELQFQIIQGGPKSCAFFNKPYLWNRSRQK